jgi:hypothetical protein
MAKSKKRLDPLPEKFQTPMEAGEFWDNHDLVDYWQNTKEVKMSIKVPPTPRYVPLEKEVAEFIAGVAKKQHISIETLVNLWLKERVTGRGRAVRLNLR